MGTGKDTGMGKGKGVSNVVPTGSCQATCKSFAAKMGWGFIEYEGVDVFLHVKDCVDGSIPKTGDVLTFDVEESTVKAGQMKASNVTGGTGWPWGEDGKGKGKDFGKGDDKGKGKGKGKDSGKDAWGGKAWGK